MILHVFIRILTVYNTINNMNSKRKCLHCGEELDGRADQKFCNDSCRARHHNTHKNPGEQEIRRINSLLRHNRKVLRTLCPEGKTTVRKDVLDRMGFNYEYFTRIYRTQNNQVYFLNYDYAFLPLVQEGTKKVLIIQRQDYMDRYELPLWPEIDKN